MKKIRIIWVSIITSLMLFVTLVAGNVPFINNTTNTYAATYDYGLASDAKDGAILQAWNWSFDTIKEELPEIAAAGYTSVQTSPIQGTKESEMDTGHWWLLYQPTNFEIGNYQLGTRDEFKSMCEEAEKYGINIIVDVVCNHMANSSSSTYYADSSVDSTIRDNENMWHEHSGISSYDDRWQVTHLGINLPDLNTSNWDLQNIVIDFLNDCITCGADGFRFDAAKHIELPTDSTGSSDFWSRVLASLDRDDLFIYGEVLQGGADNYAAYTDYMNVTASSYGFNVRSAVGYNSSVNVENAKSYSVPSGVDYSDLVTWVESHDNYAGNDEDSTYMSDYQIKMAWGIVGARAESTPMFFARPAGSSKNSGNMGVVGSTLWEDSDIAAVNKFHNDMEGESEYLRTQGSNIMMVERGTKGMVIVNLGDSATISSSTNMKDGTYTDQISKNTFTVSNGTITGSVNGYSIAVVYNTDDPTVSSSKDSSSYVDSLDVTLSASDVDYAAYSIDGASEVTYTSGTSIILGSDKAVGAVTTLKLTGYKDGEAVTTAEYEYTKAEKLENPIVYLQEQSGWGSPNVYIYDDSSSTVKEVASWPGVAMEQLMDDVYTYTLPDGWDSAKIIFNDGSNQVPAAQQAGLEISAGESKIYADGEWRDFSFGYNEIELTSVSLTTDKTTPQTLGTTITLIAAAEGGIGTVNYEFSVADSVNTSTTLSAYSESNTATWTPSEAGTYILTVKAKDDDGTEVTTNSTFVINEVSDETKVYFNNTVGWSAVNVYVYDESGSSVKEIASWPGVAMTSEGNNIYSYTIPDYWTSANVIFTDGSNQIPAAMQTGFVINAGESKIYNNGSWEDYK